MPNYKRIFIPGAQYFFTVVTYNRQPILTKQTARELLREAILNVKDKHPFEINAICLLPDHLHCIWTLPPDDFDYSLRWRLLKGQFSHHYLKIIDDFNDMLKTQKQRRGAGIWQHRFWEHYIRDDRDYECHFDYIHYNPVKHGLVNTPQQWPWSTYHKYQKLGYYEDSWGNKEKIDLKGSKMFGE